MENNTVFNKDIPFQNHVDAFVGLCFGMQESGNVYNRACRFVEEALELAQSVDIPAEDILLLVNYVYSRPQGNAANEIGGVMVTLAALATAAGVDLQDAAFAELTRIWAIKDKIQAKFLSRPINSPLPQKVEVNSAALPDKTNAGLSFAFIKDKILEESAKSEYKQAAIVMLRAIFYLEGLPVNDLQVDKNSREELRSTIKAKQSAIRALEREVEELTHKDYLLSDNQRWFTEELEAVSVNQGRKKISVEKLVGRINWMEDFTDMATGKTISCKRSRVVRVDGKWM